MQYCSKIYNNSIITIKHFNLYVFFERKNILRNITDCKILLRKKKTHSRILIVKIILL